jgi:tetratricopeptide (TPR) repeat protein
MMIGDSKMNRKLLVLFTIGMVILIASGCGSGGGSGRYTIPPEIPTPGTGGTGGGGGGTGETDPDSLIASAWEDFRYGAYSSAINKFNQVLTISNISDEQKTQSYNGLGWALTKSSGVESGYSAFTQAASTNNEARIGLAAALMQRGQLAGFKQAIQVLEQVGLQNTAFVFQSTHPIGISNAEAHAMLAFCYFWRNELGDHDKARSQINVARAEDSSNDSSVAQIYKSLQDLGLSGI